MLERIALSMMLCSALALGACSDDTDQPDSRIDRGVDQGSDTSVEGGLDEGVEAGDDQQADLPPAPAAPTISTPTGNQEVFNSFEVAGTGEVDASVQARVLLQTAVLGTASATVGSGGSYSLTVTYTGAQPDDVLTVEVTQSNAGGTSPAASVSVKHVPPHTISGTVTQASGSDQGSAVFVRLYTSNAPADLLDYVDEVQLGASPGSLLSATDYEFKVGNGTYYLRAFRDSGGRGGGPDGEPTLDADAQSGAVQVVVNDASATRALTLLARTDVNDRYSGFDARAYHESTVARPPSKRSGGKRELGLGFCRGYYMRLSAHREGNESHLTAPRVRLPSGAKVALLNDGGCSDDVLDNTSSSYDFQAGDSEYSYGLPNPTANHAGDYTIFYLQTVDDFVHIETDEVASVVKLPHLREMQPTGATANTSLQPNISWTPVAGAAFYDVSLRQTGDGGYDNHADPGRWTASTSYTPNQLINDDACYRLQVRAMDVDPASGDVDAEGNGSEVMFCTDVDGNDTVTVSGAISDETGKNAPYVIEVNSSGSDERRASVRRPATATSYSVVVLAGQSADGGSIEAFVDAAATGERETLENRSLTMRAGWLDLRNDATKDLAFNPPVQVTSPANWVTTSTTPTFQWQDYASTAGGAAPTAFSYALFIQDPVEGPLPDTIIGLPPSATSLDLSNIPTGTGHFDVVAFFSCKQGGGSYSIDVGGTPSCTGGSGMTPSITTLPAGEAYSWGLVVIPCDWTDFTPPNATTFLDCVESMVQQQSFFAQSEEREFWTQ